MTPRDILTRKLGKETYADEILAALRDAGFVVAPVEPTQAMHVAAHRDLRCWIHDIDWAEDTFGAAYRAMIKVA